MNTPLGINGVGWFCIIMTAIVMVGSVLVTMFIYKNEEKK